MPRRYSTVNMLTACPTEGEWKLSGLSVRWKMQTRDSCKHLVCRPSLNVLLKGHGPILVLRVKHHCLVSDSIFLWEQLAIPGKVETASKFKINRDAFCFSLICISTEL